MDNEWIRNLAEARLVNGAWQLKDPEGVKHRATGRLLDTVQDLYRDALTACELYNLHCASGRAIRVIPLTPEDDNALRGFIFLLGRVQLRVEQSGFRLEVTLTEVRQFRHTQHRLFSLEPRFDAFGGLSWLTDNGLT